VHELLPEGIDDLRDCPHPLFEAIRVALMVLGFDELEDNERPPKRIWLDGQRLQEWFKDVRRKRREKYDPKGGGEIEDPVQNEAARSLIVG